MTSLREAIARAIVSAGYNPATAPAIADAVLAILPDAEALADALEPFATFSETFVDDEGWSGPMRTTRIVDWLGPSDFRCARDALANYRKGTGREG